MVIIYIGLIIFFLIFLLLGYYFLKNYKEKKKFTPLGSLKKRTSLETLKERKFLPRPNISDRRYPSGTTHLILTSAQCKPYQDWQSYALYYSAQKVWPEAEFIRLLACDDTGNQYQDIVPSFITRDYGFYNRDDYLPYNRPGSLKDFFETLPRSTLLNRVVVLTDPDIILLKPLDFYPSLGQPIAQLYDYMNNNDALQKITKKLAPHLVGKTQPVGMPMIMWSNDLEKVSQKWLEYTVKIRKDPELKDLAGWIAEMHSYALASADVGLEHIIRDDLADRYPYNRKDPYLIHYDLPSPVPGGKTWNKRDYMYDLLASQDLMQIPKTRNASYKYFLQEINNALLDFRTSFRGRQRR